MKDTIVRRALTGLAGWMGLHPDVSTLISRGFELTNPSKAIFPAENLPLASRVIASGMWNYCFFQFYQNFAGPYWVERQYNPKDPSFIPRAGSMLSLNLTHRNWLGVRGPVASSFGMIDPAGALSPVIGYYSIELAFKKNGRVYLPARQEVEVTQHLPTDLPIPVTEYRRDDLEAAWTVCGSPEPDGTLINVVEFKCTDDWEMILGIRPFNPEGAALIQNLMYKPFSKGARVIINNEEEIELLDVPDNVCFSTLEQGDAYFSENHDSYVNCNYGIATGALHYKLRGEGLIRFVARTYEQMLPAEAEYASKKNRKKNKTPSVEPIGPGDIEPSEMVVTGASALTDRYRNPEILKREVDRTVKDWTERVEGAALFHSARPLWNRAARINTGFVLSLQTEDKITPGVFTYRQFWFRDAAYMISALTEWNLLKEARTVLDTYPSRQDKDGFFRSHEGEWDSNGQALWTLAHFARLAGDSELIEQTFRSVRSGCNWIVKKRKKGYRKRLMPAGFSAEHLGPADNYYWDNIWSIGGLIASAEMARTIGKSREERIFLEKAREYESDFLSISLPDRQKYGVLTAAPNRPVDSGMIGSICMLYPLELDLLPEEEVRSTVMTIYNTFFLRGLFFHPIIHSGFNIYLSLQMAQCLFRLGEVKEARKVLKRVLQSRTELWTYPEAIHPNTGGGVMGDGFHGWAAAELLLLLRRFVVSETNDEIELFKGLRKKELEGEGLKFGPFPVYGTHITIEADISRTSGRIKVVIPKVSQTPLRKLKIYLGFLDLSALNFRSDQAKLTVKGKSVQLETSSDVLQLDYRPR